MPRFAFHGPYRHRISSFLALNRIAIATYLRRLAGHRIAPDWTADQEIGVMFWRRQFTKAMRHPDRDTGRAILDSLQTETDDIYAVTSRPNTAPIGDWHIPNRRVGTATILYLHGGGLAFHGKISLRFAQMLCHHTGAPLFAPDYRLTPEHKHPAQIDDALSAWHYLSQQTDPGKIVLIGDSAGGYLALMLMQKLRDLGLPQPALTIGLCPWTDIGNRGASLQGNDRYDLVQGWMALKFGDWLDAPGVPRRTELSPISYGFAGLAPLYLQTGGRENLHDMIVDFAQRQAQAGADVMLDAWPGMVHDFQLLDGTIADAQQANARIAQAVRWAVDGGDALASQGQTRLATGRFRAPGTQGCER